MLYSFLLTIDVLLAIGVIVLVLLQHGKGADAGAAFGSGASATVFGSRGSASFLSHATAILATLFFVNSLGLAYIVTHRPTDSSVVEQLSEQPLPATPMDDTVESGPASDLPAEGRTTDVPSGSTEPDVPGIGGTAGDNATERAPTPARKRDSNASPVSDPQTQDDVPR
jgi:preprotein translocase subunit SecG